MFGEFKVSRLLEKHLQPPAYHVLNDVTVPSINGTTQVDHVVVSPHGIFVIETKNYSGWIFGSARNREWTQTIRGKKSSFQNPIHQNYAHIKALEAATGLDESVLHSIVVFVGDAKFKTMIPDGVCFAGDLIDRIKLKGRRLLSDAEIMATVQSIRAGRLEPGFRTDAAHVQNLSERFAEGAGTAFSTGLTRGLKKTAAGLAIKLVAVLIFVIIFMQAMGHIQESLRNLGSVTTQIQPRPTTQISAGNQSSPQAAFKQQQRLREAQQRQAWELSLRCGYSIDTKRCVCYDRKGSKVNIEFERCKVLATGNER